MTSIWKWESGNLQIKKSLLDGLQITETAKEVISVVGAGGKTTTIRRLTDEMEKRQKNVAVTTTTRMKKEPHFLLGADAERITQRWGRLIRCGLENRMIIRKRSEVFQKRFWMR